MPYSKKQCRLFGVMSSGKIKNKKGKTLKPPSDWMGNCRKKGNKK